MYKIQIADKYKSLTTFIESVPAIFDTSGQIIYQSRNVVKVFEVATSGIDKSVVRLNVKRYPPPRGINSIVYSISIRKPKGARAFNNPSLLLERGIDTPEAVAYIEQRHGLLLGYSYFISLQSAYGHTMYELRDAKEDEYEALAIQFAAFTAEMHGKDILHLDYSPGNILFTKDDRGNYRFMLVDINRMRFGPVSMSMGLRSFRRLWGPKRFFVLVISEYSKLRGYEIKESVHYALKERERFWLHYLKKHPDSISNVEL